MKLGCGCEHDGEAWKRCVTHEVTEAVETRLEEVFGPPRCPESGCHVDARRPKCMWEGGASCPRHRVLDLWRNLVRAAVALQLERMEEE